MWGWMDGCPSQKHEKEQNNTKNASHNFSVHTSIKSSIHFHYLHCDLLPSLSILSLFPLLSSIPPHPLLSSACLSALSPLKFCCSLFFIHHTIFLQRFKVIQCPQTIVARNGLSCQPVCFVLQAFRHVFARFCTLAPYSAAVSEHVSCHGN